MARRGTTAAQRRLWPALALCALLPMRSSAAPKPMKANRLIKEKSPYLLQHAHNPVDWYPWGEEAFAKARKEEKPIFLSIGYSTCHWCHVMERESFEDPKIAALMNASFVSIKLDREERPDVDRIYMTAVQTMTGQGGWPLNVFLTPDLKPFFGGTYFPPEARWGQPGFPQLLGRISGLWKTRREEIHSDAAKLSDAVKKYVAAEAKKAPLDAAWLDRAYAAYKGSFDTEHAGFAGAPKFPMPVNLAYLLRYHARTGEKEALTMVHDTLRAMGRGGIYDQVGGGFHRYSTDAEWRVPHFEKMLYDNAQLASVYLEAHQAAHDPELARVSRETLDYLLRDMRDPKGGFYSAEDADSLPPEAAPGGKASPEAARDRALPRAEGAFYLWSEKELQEILGSEAEDFIKHYGVEKGGNAPADPHGEFEGKNILYISSKDDKAPSFEGARKKLLQVRSRRPRPGLDDKVLTSWNGLAISAFAKGWQALGERIYLEAAEKAAGFVKAELYDPKSKRLYHRWRQGERAVPGMADDYAFLIQGLLDLYEASFDTDLLDWAAQLQGTQDRLFSAPEGGFYLTGEDHDKNLLARVMDDTDNVEPSASSVSAVNLLRLAQYGRRDDFRKAAEKTLERFGRLMAERPLSMAQMLSAADFALSKPRQIVIAGEPATPGMADMLHEVRARFLPVKILIRADEASKQRLKRSLPFLENVDPIAGKATAYVCENYACKLPTNDLSVLKRLLDEKPPK